MATDSTATTALEDRVKTFLTKNFPQIQMHGGNASILDLDPETGSVTVLLGGACSGCGISPMTIQAIKSRMVDEIPEINEVIAETGEMDDEGGDKEGHDSMGGHPAGGGGAVGDISGEVPDWRKDD
jgi:Fe/S biogenesis protein NfuA